MTQEEFKMLKDPHLKTTFDSKKSLQLKNFS